MSDPIIQLANLRLIEAHVQLERELMQKAPGWFLEIYRRLRGRAAEALAAISFADADKADEVRALQNRVKLFDEFLQEVRALINDGMRLAQQMSDEEREEILDYLAPRENAEEVGVDAAAID